VIFTGAHKKLLVILKNNVMTFYTYLEIQRRVNALLNSSSTDENDENWLSDIISSREYNLLPFHNAFADYILRRISKKIDLSELNKWSFFHVAFRHFLIANIGIELRCTEIRRHILLGSAKNLACVKQFQNLAMSIAVQCYKNEYVYYIQPDEIDAINKIRLQFDQVIENNAGWEVIDNLLHLILMYFSPLDLKHFKKIEFDEYSETNYQLAAFIGSIITDSEKEIALSNKYLNSFTLKSHVSKKVAAMYERNPYPRWTEPLVSMNPNRTTFEEFAGVGGFPKYQVWQRSIDTIIIAGCGTG